ncbi:MAG: hypothetical protein KIT36_18265 [Alphaproteobacteria bacterium]|nr:hypothetical protein [Alphaproteobacteria bacterium]
MRRRIVLPIALACVLSGTVSLAVPRDDARGHFLNQIQGAYTQCGTAWFAAADIILPANAGAFARRAVKPRTIYVRLDDVTWTLEETSPSADERASGVTFRGRGIGSAATIVRRDVPWQATDDGVGDWTSVRPQQRTTQGRAVFLDRLFLQRREMTSKHQFDIVSYIAWSDGVDQYMHVRRPTCGEVPR